jgi:hypothetical protein
MLQPLTFTVHSHANGKVEFTVPAELADRDIQITVAPLEHPETDANGWPIGFFERTYGALADDPIDRGDTFLAENRESME